ncbi:MAG TPA: TIGR03960 family B12-binding radical SAM protein, partial [Elusimicrobia bacterium]|nr:TIGR03960 family B12-binding radical SAM protein [Elusimicrobiota bacterium]
MNLEKILPLVVHPLRYINHEWNVKIPPENLEKLTRVCFSFPDLYEVGASNLGLSILYHIVNLRADAYAERVYAPEKDFSEYLLKYKFPLFSLETRTPLNKFHLLGFSLQYELCYTNVLNILDLAGIPLKSTEREEVFPLVIAGGPCVTANPEPVADFFDLFVIGEGEEIINEIIDTVISYRSSVIGKNKKELLRKLAEIEGIYVPSFYEIKYNSNQTITVIQPKEKTSDKIISRKVNLENAEYPTRPIVPYLETVHERLNIEIMRGCPWGCRFCQAGSIYRPYRERSKEKILSLIEQSLPATGYEEIALTGLSVSDYREIEDLIKVLVQRYGDRHLKLSLPSLRCDRFSVDLMKLLEGFPQTTLTFAPEAGSENLRSILKKKISDEDIFTTLGTAYTNGWRKIKLYFMYGLPQEKDEDLKAIVSLAKKIKKLYPGISLTFTISPFVPKAQTPFQWCKQEGMENLKEKKKYLSHSLPGEVRAHSVKMSILESIFARGDRRLSEVILLAWK